MNLLSPDRTFEHGAISQLNWAAKRYKINVCRSTECHLLNSRGIYAAVKPKIQNRTAQSGAANAIEETTIIIIRLIRGSLKFCEILTSAQ